MNAQQNDALQELAPPMEAMGVPEPGGFAGDQTQMGAAVTAPEGGQDELTLALYTVQAWKGATLSLLLTLALVREGVNARWLARNSGYSEKPVAQALSYLEERGLAQKSKQGWQLSQQGRQLLLCIAGGLVSSVTPQGQTIETQPGELPDKRSPEEAHEALAGQQAGDLTHDSADHPREAHLPGERQRQGAGEPVQEKRWKFSLPATTVNDSGFKIAHQSSSSRGAEAFDPPENAQGMYENRLVLQKAGVGEPKLSSLACMPGLQAADIRAWVAHLRQRRGGEYHPGLLIHVLEMGDPPPRGYAGACALSQEERELKRHKYAEWEE
jgi:hypothetical protein